MTTVMKILGHILVFGYLVSIAFQGFAMFAFLEVSISMPCPNNNNNKSTTVTSSHPPKPGLGNNFEFRCAKNPFQHDTDYAKHTHYHFKYRQDRLGSSSGTGSTESRLSNIGEKSENNLNYNNGNGNDTTDDTMSDLEKSAVVGVNVTNTKPGDGDTHKNKTRQNGMSFEMNDENNPIKLAGHDNTMAKHDSKYHTGVDDNSPTHLDTSEISNNSFSVSENTRKNASKNVGMNYYRSKEDSAHGNINTAEMAQLRIGQEIRSSLNSTDDNKRQFRRLSSTHENTTPAKNDLNMATSGDISLEESNSSNNNMALSGIDALRDVWNLGDSNNEASEDITTPKTTNNTDEQKDGLVEDKTKGISQGFGTSSKYDINSFRKNERSGRFTRETRNEKLSDETSETDKTRMANENTKSDFLNGSDERNKITNATAGVENLNIMTNQINDSILEIVTRSSYNNLTSTKMGVFDLNEVDSGSISMRNKLYDSDVDSGGMSEDASSLADEKSDNMDQKSVTKGTLRETAEKETTMGIAITTTATSATASSTTTASSLQLATTRAKEGTQSTQAALNSSNLASNEDDTVFHTSPKTINIRKSGGKATDVDDDDGDNDVLIEDGVETEDDNTYKHNGNDTDTNDDNMDDDVDNLLIESAYHVEVDRPGGKDGGHRILLYHCRLYLCVNGTDSILDQGSSKNDSNTTSTSNTTLSPHTTRIPDAISTKKKQDITKTTNKRNRTASTTSLDSTDKNTVTPTTSKTTKATNTTKKPKRNGKNSDKVISKYSTSAAISNDKNGNPTQSNTNRKNFQDGQYTGFQTKGERELVFKNKEQDKAKQRKLKTYSISPQSNRPLEHDESIPKSKRPKRSSDTDKSNSTKSSRMDKVYFTFDIVDTTVSVLCRFEKEYPKHSDSFLHQIVKEYSRNKTTVRKRNHASSERKRDNGIHRKTLWNETKKSNDHYEAYETVSRENRYEPSKSNKLQRDGNKIFELKDHENKSKAQENGNVTSKLLYRHNFYRLQKNDYRTSKFKDLDNQQKKDYDIGHLGLDTNPDSLDAYQHVDNITEVRGEMSNTPMNFNASEDGKETALLNGSGKSDTTVPDTLGSIENPRLRTALVDRPENRNTFSKENTIGFDGDLSVDVHKDDDDDDNNDDDNEEEGGDEFVLSDHDVNIKGAEEKRIKRREIIKRIRNKTLNLNLKYGTGKQLISQKNRFKKYNKRIMRRNKLQHGHVYHLTILGLLHSILDEYENGMAGSIIHVITQVLSDGDHRRFVEKKLKSNRTERLDKRNDGKMKWWEKIWERIDSKSDDDKDVGYNGDGNVRKGKKMKISDDSNENDDDEVVCTRTKYSRVALYIQVFGAIATGFCAYYAYKNTVMRIRSPAYLSFSTLVATTLGVVTLLLWSKATGNVTEYHWSFWPYITCFFYILLSAIIILAHMFCVDLRSAEETSHSSSNGARRDSEQPFLEIANNGSPSSVVYSSRGPSVSIVDESEAGNDGSHSNSDDKDDNKTDMSLQANESTPLLQQTDQEESTGTTAATTTTGAASTAQANTSTVVDLADAAPLTEKLLPELDSDSELEFGQEFHDVTLLTTNGCTG